MKELKGTNFLMPRAIRIRDVMFNTAYMLNVKVVKKVYPKSSSFHRCCCFSFILNLYEMVDITKPHGTIS